MVNIFSRLVVSASRLILLFLLALSVACSVGGGSENNPDSDAGSGSNGGSSNTASNEECEIAYTSMDLGLDGDGTDYYSTGNNSGYFQGQARVDVTGEIENMSFRRIRVDVCNEDVNSWGVRDGDLQVGYANVAKSADYPLASYIIPVKNTSDRLLCKLESVDFKAVYKSGEEVEEIIGGFLDGSYALGYEYGDSIPKHWNSDCLAPNEVGYISSSIEPPEKIDGQVVDFTSDISHFEISLESMNLSLWEFELNEYRFIPVSFSPADSGMSQSLDEDQSAFAIRFKNESGGSVWLDSTFPNFNLQMIEMDQGGYPVRSSLYRLGDDDLFTLNNVEVGPGEEVTLYIVESHERVKPIFGSTGFRLIVAYDIFEPDI